MTPSGAPSRFALSLRFLRRSTCADESLVVVHHFDAQPPCCAKQLLDFGLFESMEAQHFHHPESLDVRLDRMVQGHDPVELRTETLAAVEQHVSLKKLEQRSDQPLSLAPSRAWQP